MSKFVKGDRVGTYDGKLRYGDEYQTPYYGIITDELYDGSVMVQWDKKDEWKNTRRQVYNPEKLYPEQELREKYSTLEIEFKRVEEEVRQKLIMAGQIILDAGKFAKQAGFDLMEMYKATSGLENAMEKAGWNTSSWHC